MKTRLALFAPPSWLQGSVTIWSGRLTERKAGKVVAIQGIGTTDNDTDAFVEVVMHDGQTYAIAFDEGICNELAIAFLAASNHLLGKIAARQGSESTLIPGQPLPLSSGSVTVAQAGPDRVVVLDLKTDQGLSLLFSMTPRSADILAKRLTNRKMARLLEPQKGKIQ